MEYQIWRFLIQICSFRNDLTGTIKPFFEQLNNNNNNEKYNLNKKEHIPFIKTLLNFQLEFLHNSEIIDEEIFKAVERKKQFVYYLKSDYEEIVKDIIKNDNLEELQRLIREKGIKPISPIKKSFNEIERMEIPIIIECIIQKATKCFKYLLINGIEDPTKTMYTIPYTYMWDCMSIAIYYGEVEIMTILEEKCIEKGKNSGHIEAAILSYRNDIAKEIIIKIKEKNQNIDDKILTIGISAASKSNNIKGAELIIYNGANVNVFNDIYQIKIILFLINIIQNR